MTGDVNEAINQICEKLGTSVEYIVPRIAEMKSILYIYNSVVDIILTALSIIVLYLIIRFTAKHFEWMFSDDYEDMQFVCIIGFIIIVIFVCIILFFKFFDIFSDIRNAILWTHASEAMVFEYILDMVK